MTARYTLRMELERVQPLVWRRLQVQTTMTLPKLAIAAVHCCFGGF